MGQMLRIVKILSMASIGLAALTMAVVLAQIVRGGEPSPYLSELGAIELYKQKAGSVKPTTETESPLVKQAKLIQLAWNPPPPEPKETAKPAPTGPKEIVKPTDERPEPKVALNPKFKLIATACYTSVPDKSMALLDLTSQGPKWYRQGETVEGLTIREITETEVTLFQGDKLNSTVAMVQSPTIFPSILKGDPAAGQPVVPVSSLMGMPENPNPNPNAITLPPNMTARDLPKLLEKHTLEEIRAAGAATAPTSNIVPAKPTTTDAAGDSRTATRRAGVRPGVPPTRTIPNAPVKTVAPPPTPEQQRAELDKNIEDIRKLMNTPTDSSSGANPSEDQKAWGELLKLLEDERKNFDPGTGGPAAPPPAPEPAPTPAPAPTPPAEQPAPPPVSEPAPSAPPAEAGETQPTPPPSDSPPANTENGGN